MVQHSTQKTTLISLSSTVLYTTIRCTWAAHPGQRSAWVHVTLFLAVFSSKFNPWGRSPPWNLMSVICKNLFIALVWLIWALTPFSIIQSCFAKTLQLSLQAQQVPLLHLQLPLQWACRPQSRSASVFMGYSSSARANPHLYPRPTTPTRLPDRGFRISNLLWRAPTTVWPFPAVFPLKRSFIMTRTSNLFYCTVLCKNLF